MRILLLLPPSLSLLYAASVHLFLSFFHERHITHLRYWQPILIRCTYFAIIALVTWLWIDEYCSSTQGDDTGDAGSCNWNEIQAYSFPNSYHASVAFAAAVANLLISTYLIVDTRRSEVDGPMPPLPTVEKPIGTADNKLSSRVTSMKDKVVLITGANAGIGLETARQLYKRGAIIVLACRSRHRAAEAMSNIDSSVELDQSNVVKSSEKKRMYFLPLDLTSVSSVRKAVELFDKMKLPLHVLINNAGVMRQKREETEDGIEMTMAANYFGHFLLTNLLLPKLRQTAMQEKYPSKVITLSSSLYTRAFRHKTGTNSMELGIDLADLQCQHKRYTLFDQYSQSKLANILFARELGRREKLRAQKMQQNSTAETDTTTESQTFCPIQSYAVHPGLVRTNVVRDMPWYLYYPNIVFAIFMAVLQKTPRSGAYTSVYCAVVDDFKTEGDQLNEVCYYVNSAVVELSQAGRSYEDAEKLWKLSCDMMDVPSDE